MTTQTELDALVDELRVIAKLEGAVLLYEEAKSAGNAADMLEAQAKRIAELERPPAPDCRTCADRLRCVNTWHEDMTCTNGDQYQPGKPVVLWRTE